jgi:hypothetical protein
MHAVLNQARALILGRLGPGWANDADLGIARAGLGPADRAAMQALFEEALMKFGKTPTILIMIAGFYLEWDRNVYLTLRNCNSALEASPAADEVIRVRVIQTVALAYEAVTVAGAAAANNQLEYRKHVAVAETAVLALERSKQKLFAGLRAAVVSLDDALKVGREITASYEKAVEEYKTALVLSPGSLITMRAYASLLQGMHDRVAAADIFATADALEETRNKQSARVYGRITFNMDTSFDVALETNGVVQIAIDGHGQKIGTILAANAEVCRIFGYSKQVCAGPAPSRARDSLLLLSTPPPPPTHTHTHSDTNICLYIRNREISTARGAQELLRANINAVVPQPMSVFHEESIRRYGVTGKGAVINYQRIVFGVKKSGHAIPLAVLVRGHIDGTSCVGVIQAITTRYNFMLCSGLSHEVTALCEASAKEFEPVAGKLGEQARHVAYVPQFFVF